MGGRQAGVVGISGLSLAEGFIVILSSDRSTWIFAKWLESWFSRVNNSLQSAKGQMHLHELQATKFQTLGRAWQRYPCQMHVVDMIQQFCSSRTEGTGSPSTFT